MTRPAIHVLKFRLVLAVLREDEGFPVITNSRAKYVIREVILEHDAEVLVATVKSDESHLAQFAFYVFRNGERIHVREYTSDPVLRFDTNAEPGLYRVLAFFGVPSGKKNSKYSNPLFLHPVTYGLGGGLRKPLSEHRALLLQGNHWKFPAVYYAGKEQQPLFVMLSAAIDRSKHSLPAFNRWTWADKFPGHVLCVADPTLELHNGMELGWYLGTEKYDATEELCMLISQFAEALGIPHGMIVFWGSSGGGFAALALASRIEGTIAVAINAQTDIFAYEIARSVEAIRERCFGGLSVAQIQKHFLVRVNMAEAWRNNRSSRAIIVQNQMDEHHYKMHFHSFWKALGGNPQGKERLAGRHYALLYEDTRGHGPESEEMLKDILCLIYPESVTSGRVA